MSYVYLLDGIDFGPPVNDRDLLTTIKRNANLDGFLVTQDADLIWQGAAYDYLYDKFFNDGYCSEVEVDIIDECDNGQVFDIYTGIIKMSAIEIDADLCQIRCKVDDNSFYSYINNNKSIGVSPTATGTKNGTEITPPDIWEIRVFDPSTGVYDLTTRKAYRVYDLLEHAITVITDGKVGFVSDFLWNQEDELFLTTGNALSEAGNPPEFFYSFEKLYSELNKAFNLSFFIETDLYSIPTLRIEPKEYFYSLEDGITFSDIKELKIAVDQTKIYGTVVLGSSILSDSQGVFSFNEDIPFYGFKQEKFYPIGQCNLDVELNLVNDYVISSLVIEDCIIGLSDNYYDELFFISCDNLDVINLTADAIGYQLGGVAPPYLYNLNLNNYNKAQRYFSFLPGNLLDAFNVSSNIFHAENTTEHVFACGANVQPGETLIPMVASGSTANTNFWTYNSFTTPYPFPDESSPGNYDLGGNYNNSTYMYIVPSDGRYTFKSSIFAETLRWDSSAIGIETLLAMRVRIRRYDSGMVFIEQTLDDTYYNIPPIAGMSFSQPASGVFDCLTGDRILVQLEFEVRLFDSLVFPSPNTAEFAVKVKLNSFFESNSDNLLVGANDVNYKVIRYEFKYPIPAEDFRTLLADPTGIQTFTKWSETAQEFREWRGWIEEIKFRNWTGESLIKIIANNAINEE